MKVVVVIIYYLMVFGGFNGYKERLRTTTAMTLTSRMLLLGGGGMVGGVMGDHSDSIEDRQDENHRFNNEEDEDRYYGRHDIGLDGEGGGEGDFYHDWEAHLEDFHPNMMMTFTVNPNSIQEFTEDVTIPGQLLRGLFLSYSADGETTGTDFQILNPKGEVFFEKRDTGEAIFYKKAEVSGKYRIIITNRNWRDEHEVTLAVMVGGSKSLKTEHIADLEDQIEILDNLIRDTQSESTYLWIRQKNHLKAVESMQSRVLWFFLFDFVALAVTAWFQVYYVKGLLMDRRFI